ncbi:MAG: class I SAM-dependent methyltransferase [Verrucomicrobia bacterium]|nr:class I SAM-dependent methyltransferase [Verrucomicrobiota bacterium]
MITRTLNAFRGAVRGWKTPPPVAGRDWHPTWLPEELTLGLESTVHPHCPEERGELFVAHNTGSTEIETLNWLHATVCLTKPAQVLETGALDGLGTLALAAACRDNGFGRVHSVEIDAAACERIAALIRRHGLSRHVEIHCGDSRDFLRTTREQFAFGFFDSLCDIRAEEYRICLERSLLSGIAAFHDTSAYRNRTLPNDPTPAVQAEYRRQVLELARDPRHSGHFEHVLSRGLIVLFPRVNPPAAA